MPKRFKVLALKQTMHTFPRLWTDGRFYRWADWIVKDNQMLKKDGMELNPKECDEARFERATLDDNDIKIFVEKHCRIALLDANRIVDRIEKTISYGIIMAIDQMHLNCIKLK